MNKNSVELIDKLLVRLFYLTPVFMFLDYIFEFNIRISFLSEFPYYKFIYYLICCFFALVVYKFPVYTYYVAFIESMINLGINIVGFSYPYITSIGIPYDDINDKLQFYNLETIINFIISGTVLILSVNLLQLRISSMNRGVS